MLYLGTLARVRRLAFLIRVHAAVVRQMPGAGQNLEFDLIKTAAQALA